MSQLPHVIHAPKRNGVRAFEAIGLDHDAALRKESEVFDLLEAGARPEALAVAFDLTVPTIYAIDKREASRRGCARNLGRNRNAPAPSPSEGH